MLLLALACYASAEIYTQSEALIQGQRTTAPDGTVSAVDSETEDTIEQGSATDGGSKVAGKLYGAFSIIIGLVLSTIGLRERWRVGAGFNVGLVAAMIRAYAKQVIWIVFIDNIGKKSLASTDKNSDVIIFVATGIVFLVVTLVVVFARGVKVGQALFGPIGFTALGLTAMLLIPSSATDELWPRALLVGLLAGIGLASFFFKPTRRAGQALGVSWSGLFMFLLGVNLIVESPDGYSLGLRKFFDSNLRHYVDLDTPYELTTPTIVMCAITIALGPFVALAQHKVHPSPIHQWGVDSEPDTEKRWSNNRRYRPSLPTATGIIYYGGKSETPSTTSSMTSIKKSAASQRPPAPTRVRTKSSAMTFDKVVESPLEGEFEGVQKLGYASGGSSEDSHGNSSTEKSPVEPVVIELKDNKTNGADKKEEADKSDESSESGDEEHSAYSHSSYSPTKRDLSILTKSKSMAASQAQLSQAQLASISASQTQLAQSQLAQMHSQFAGSNNQLSKAQQQAGITPSQSMLQSKSQTQSLALSQSNVFPESQIFSTRTDSLERVPDAQPQRTFEDPVLHDSYDAISKLERHLSMIVEDRATENDLMAQMPGSPFTGPAPRRGSVVTSPTKMLDSPSMLSESATFSPIQSHSNINGVTLTEALTDESRDDRLKENMDAVSLHPSLIDDDDFNVIYKYGNDDKF
ncbi:hypothetical protein E3P99_00433 [Wallemia hederae]|uniref:TM7S3/TM198-like domain-containing protein n=1 Tax=Wallemia hederae TaxID=1540922 RepID=A0A4T0G0U2_9BASI|nr:hypothetical protein E3P99_00433 [Wallemia hederae]